MSARDGRPSTTVFRACRACGHALTEILTFGELPLANALVPPEMSAGTETRVPMHLMRCEKCFLVQLAESVDPAYLFGHYKYLSSTSDAFVSHAARLVERLVDKWLPERRGLAVEVGSNDGYLLQHYRAAGIPVLGIEPAANIAALARERGIMTDIAFFSRGVAKRLAGGGIRADILHANNVLAHVSDLRDFVGGIAALLKPDGVAVIETPYLCDLIDGLEFDTIYHEHQCYFALSPLVGLFASENLSIIDVERIAIHGGSLRLFAQQGTQRPVSERVAALIKEEEEWGLSAPERYERFADDVRAYRPRLRDFLVQLRTQGYSLAGYGAAAKGAVLLNYCGIGHETIDFVVDRSPIKQGLALPGVRIPILAPGELVRRRPDYLLLLAWNFADEIIRQQSDYARLGGRFVVPFPTPHIIGAIA